MKKREKLEIYLTKNETKLISKLIDFMLGSLKEKPRGLAGNNPKVTFDAFLHFLKELNREIHSLDWCDDSNCLYKKKQ